MKDKILALDTDTILYRSCAVLQEDSIIAEHKTHKFYKPCKNVTSFYGTKKNELGGWLNDFNTAENTSFTKEDFNIEVDTKIVAHDGVAYKRLREYISELYDLPWVKDIKIVLAGKDNYRHKIFSDYKAGRLPKPLRFEAVKDWFIEEFKDNVVLSHGAESDDYVSILGWWGYRKYGKDTPIVVGHCDKDCDQIPGLHFNFDKRTAPYWIDELQGCRRLCEQILLGDTTDNIKGLPEVNEDLAEKYNLKKGGVGIAKAKKILDGCDTIECLLREVQIAYMCYYGEEYKEPLNLTYKLVKLMEEKDVIPEFPFRDYKI